MRGEGGFTLIELIMVIVVLAILAAVAIPRYVDLAADAETSAGTAFTASIRSASSIAIASYAVNSSTLANIDATVVLASMQETGGLARSGDDFAVVINGKTYTWTVTAGATGPTVSDPVITP